MEKSGSGSTMASKREAAAKAEMAFKVILPDLLRVTGRPREMINVEYSPPCKLGRKISGSPNLRGFSCREYSLMAKDYIYLIILGVY